MSNEVERLHGFKLRSSVGSSGQLARQILAGAPFDLFLSADEHFVREVVEGGRGDAATIKVYAVGRLALWSKSGSVKDLSALAGLTRVAIANPATAPYGRLAKAALENAGLFAKLEPRLVLAESVRQTVQFAETGNVDATLTAWTLVKDRGGILLPDSLRQSGVVLSGSTRARQARLVLDFLLSPAGQKILASHGLFPHP